MPRLTKDEISRQLDEITQDVRARMATIGPTMIGLMPTESDWMTPAERTRSHELKLQLPSFGEEAVAARKRLQLKREARKRQYETALDP